jgi:hypothetical protein
MNFSENNRQSLEQGSGVAQGNGDVSGFKSAGDAAQNNASKGVTEGKNTKKTRSKKVNPLYVVIRKFWSLFKAYDEGMQNTNTKREMLNLAIRLCPKYYSDTFRWWQDLLDEANIALDSVRFNRDCQALGLNPQAVAEHLVVEGKATLNMVLKYGIQVYGEKVRMFTDRLYKDDRQLYSKSADVKSTTETSNQNA